MQLHMTRWNVEILNYKFMKVWLKKSIANIEISKEPIKSEMNLP